MVGLDSGVLFVTGGGSHNCAVLSGGTAKCWGSNGGKLGDGTTNNRLTPVGVVGLDSGVVSISAGWSHSCAVLSAGAAKCWGSNSDGQLGDGTTNDQLTPVGVVGLASGVLSIAAGTKYSCAVLSGGTAKCWGFNYNGNLGDNTSTTRLTPADVVGLVSGVVSIAVGDGHSCALLIGGAVKCWGSNWRGRVMLLLFFWYTIGPLLT